MCNHIDNQSLACARRQAKARAYACVRVYVGVCVCVRECVTNMNVCVNVREVCCVRVCMRACAHVLLLKMTSNTQTAGINY